MTPNAVRTREQRAQRAIRAVAAAKEAKRTVAHRMEHGGSQSSVDQARTVLATARRTRDTAIGLKRAGRAQAAGASTMSTAQAEELLRQHTAATVEAAAATAARAASFAAQRAAAAGQAPGLVPKRTTQAFENASFGQTQNVHVTISPQAHTLAKRWFGPDTTPEQIASLTGAPDNARVGIRTSGDRGDRLSLDVRHPDIALMQRTIRRDFDNQVRIHNDIFRAAGHGSSFNGYMTSARFGYDAPLTAFHRSAIRDRPDLAEHHDATKISNLMKTQKSRDYWRDSGTWTRMEYDLDKGGKSVRALDAYIRERKDESARGGRAMSVGLNAFARQVEQAHAMGVHSIDTDAARS